MKEYAIETKDLKIYYGKKEVIKGINLRIPKNTIFAIVFKISNKPMKII